MDGTVAEILIGGEICNRIKRIFFSDRAWSECYKDVARQFCLIKKKSKFIYPDLSKLEILHQLEGVDDQFLMDLLE